MEPLTQTTGLGEGEGRQASKERQASACRERSVARVDPFARGLLYSARPRIPSQVQRSPAMTEGEQEKAGEKKGGKRKLLAFLALIGAVIAAMAFWRRHGAEEEE